MQLYVRQTLMFPRVEQDGSKRYHRVCSLIPAIGLEDAKDMLETLNGLPQSIRDIHAPHECTVSRSYEIVIRVFSGKGSNNGSVILTLEDVEQIAMIHKSLF